MKLSDLVKGETYAVQDRSYGGAWEAMFIQPALLTSTNKWSANRYSLTFIAGSSPRHALMAVCRDGHWVPQVVFAPHIKSTLAGYLVGVAAQKVADDEYDRQYKKSAYDSRMKLARIQTMLVDLGIVTPNSYNGEVYLTTTSSHHKGMEVTGSVSLTLDQLDRLVSMAARSYRSVVS